LAVEWNRSMQIEALSGSRFQIYWNILLYVLAIPFYFFTIRIYLPSQIDGRERIVRAIFYPLHVERNGKLKAAAFRPSKGTDEVSVMRRSYLGAHACHRRAQSLGTAEKRYFGMATTSAAAIQAAGSIVSDSREEFIGHAHISHGIVIPRDEPPEPEQAKLLRDRIKAIITKTDYIACPNPRGTFWWNPPF
jgi:hypothetical protein